MLNDKVAVTALHRRLAANNKSALALSLLGENLIQELNTSSTQIINEVGKQSESNFSKVKSEFQSITPDLTSIRTSSEATREPIAQIPAIKALVDQEFNSLASNLTELKIKLSSVATDIQSIKDTISFINHITITENHAKLLFICMRALNRIEDKLIDKDPQKPAMSDKDFAKLLEGWRQDQLVNESKKVLPTDLAIRVEESYNTFKQNDLTEKLKRFLDIQQLRMDLLKHFSQAQSDTTPLSIDQPNTVGSA